MLHNLPDTVVVADLARRITLDHAGIRAERAARARRMLAAGARPNSRVVVCQSDPAAMLLDILAIWQLGATAAPLSTSLVPGERRRMADRLAPSLWVGEFEEAPVSTLAPAPLGALELGGAAPPEVAPPDDVLILTTSGTTGEPKCVSLTARALESRLALNISHIGAGALAQTLVLLPLHFGHGLIGNALTPLAAGGTIALGHSTSIEGLAQLGTTIDRQAITFLTSVPSLWRVALRASSPPAERTLQRIHVGSERLPSELWRRIEDWAGGIDVYNMFGMTETSNWISGISGREAGYADGSIGKAWGGEIRIAARPSERRGEILVRTPSLMSGYLDDPNATAEAIRDGWLHTGDVGEMDDAGNTLIVGRAKHQINRAGVKVSPEEVDKLLEGHPGVLEACAFAVPDAVSGETVAAILVPRPEAQLSFSEIRAWCAARIRAESVPHVLIDVPALPRTSRGKLDRTAARAMYCERTALGTKREGTRST